MTIRPAPGYLTGVKVHIFTRVIVEKGVTNRYAYRKGHYHRSPCRKKTGGNTSLLNDEERLFPNNHIKDTRCIITPGPERPLRWIYWLLLEVD
jgi:hypothetical protein